MRRIVRKQLNLPLHTAVREEARVVLKEIIEMTSCCEDGGIEYETGPSRMFGPRMRVEDHKYIFVLYHYLQNTDDLRRACDDY